MSSEISTSQAGFRPWHFFVLASLLAATAAVLMAARPTPEHLVLISVTLGAAGLVGAAFHRTLLPLVSSNAELRAEPLGHRSRAALERDKALTLRAIKELEFDRAMGKIADQDFTEMIGRLRARAISTMKQLDEGGSYRDIIEREVQKRVGAGAGTDAKTGSDPIFSQTVKMGSDPVHGAASYTVSAACTCGTMNDADAKFCKSCGAKLEAVR